MVVKNGRLYFSSKSYLKQKVNDLKESNGESGILEMPDLTKEGFYSLRPIIREEDTDLINSYLSRQKSNLRSAEEQEELIADDYFAFYLNETSEIQVSDSIYIYTPSGLYFVHADDIDHLYNYLENGQTNGRISPCGGGEPDLRAIDSKITQFVVSDCDDDPYVPPGEPPIVIPPDPQPSQEEIIRNFVATLPQCNQQNGWISNILGTSFICEEYFSGNHKLKTKFWNQDYFFLASIGVSVKSQIKTLGIWFNKKIDVIALGFYSAQFDFEIPIPDYPSMSTTYIYNGNVYDKNGKMQGAAAPAFPFKSPIEIFVPLPIKPLDLDYSADELNKLFWGQIWDQAKSALKDLDTSPEKKNVTFIGFLPDKVHVLHSFMEKSDTNDGSIVHYFDFNFQIGINLNIDNLSTSVNKLGKLYDYSGAKIDMYGYGLNRFIPKGSRLIAEE